MEANRRALRAYIAPYYAETGHFHLDVMEMGESEGIAEFLREMIREARAGKFDRTPEQTAARASPSPPTPEA